MTEQNQHNHIHDEHEHTHDENKHSHHAHSHGSHSHTHGVIDASISSNQKGIWAIKWSFIGLMITAIIQLTVVYFSGSIALLADTIHNFGDASTAIPLWVAFRLAQRKPFKKIWIRFRES